MSSQDLKRINAAQRLYQVLHALDHVGTAQPTTQVLTSALGFPVGDEEKAGLQAVALLSRMIDRAEDEAQRNYSEEEWPEIAPYFAGVRRCFAPSGFGVPWNQRKATLTSSDLTGLRLIALTLKRHVSEVELPKSEFEALESALAALEGEIEGADLSAYTRDLLTRCLARLRRALSDYRFDGVGEINSAYREFVGTVFSERQVRDDLKKNHKGGGKASATIWKVILAANVVMTAATQAHDVKKDYWSYLQRHLPTAPKLEHHQNTPATRILLASNEMESE